MNPKNFSHIVDNKLRGALGETDYEKGTIRINKKKSKKAGRGEVLKTIVHEEKHVKHPKMREKNVEAEMQKDVEKMPKAMKEAYYSYYRNKR